MRHLAMYLMACLRAPVLLRQSSLPHLRRCAQVHHLQTVRRSVRLQASWLLFPTVLCRRRHPREARAAGRGDQTGIGTEIDMIAVIETEIGTVIAETGAGLRQLGSHLFSGLQCCCRQRRLQ